MFLEKVNYPIKILGVFRICRQYCRKYTEKRNIHVISYRLNGESEFEQEGKTLTVANGDILYVPQGVDYRQCGDRETVIAVHLEILGAEFSEMERFSVREPKLADDLFQRLYEEWTRQNPGYEFSCHAILYEILALAAREKNYRENRREMQSEIQRAVRYVNEHFMNTELSVAILARQSGMSEVYFRKLFRKETGEAPCHYLNQRRLQFAKELLESGYYSVAEVAAESGFSDSKYFSTVFRIEYGCAPSEFRGRSVGVGNSRKSGAVQVTDEKIG